MHFLLDKKSGVIKKKVILNYIVLWLHKQKIFSS